MKRIVSILGLVVLISAVSCNSKIEEKEVAETYTATNPITIDTSFTKEYVSQIRSVKNIEIRALEKGFLQKIYIDEGQYVKEGQLLFKILPTMYEAEYQKAIAEVKAAEIEMLNTKVLSDKNVVSKNELAVAKARLDQAKAELAMAKFHLSATDIKAPFSGTIDRIPKKLGSLIDEGELLTSLSDNSQMFAYFNVSEPEYLDYQTDIKNRADSKVGLLLANGAQLKYKGNVEVIESEFDSETGNIAFRSRFPNPDKLLKNGETGKVLMTVPLKNALVIPQKATYEIQDKKFVFLIDNKSVIHSQEIKIKGEIPDLYVLESGLKSGDQILLEGIQKVKENDKIKFKAIDAGKVISNLRLKAE